MKSSLLAAVFVLVLASSVFSAGRNEDIYSLKVKINTSALAYDKLQIAYEGCMQGSPKGDRDAFVQVSLDEPNPPLTSEQETDLYARLASALVTYADGTVFLQDKFKKCQDGKTDDASVSWGFWPPDSTGELHWKAFPPLE